MLVSCVLDTPPKFQMQLRRLLASLDAVAGRSNVQVVIRHTGEIAQPDWRAEMCGGVEFLPVSAYGSGVAAYCNKVQGLDVLAASGAERILLCDLDLVFLSPLDGLSNGEAVSARIVDKPNPPPDLLERLLGECGFSGEQLNVAPAFAPESCTHYLNCNGGLYVLSASQLRELAPRWRHWAGACLSRRDLLGRYTHHADQLGFMLGMLETGLSFHSLPEHANFPTHLPASGYGSVPQRITSLHYHDRVAADGRLLRVGRSDIDRWIDAANDLLIEAGLIGNVQLACDGEGAGEQ